MPQRSAGITELVAERWLARRLGVTRDRGWFGVTTRAERRALLERAAAVALIPAPEGASWPELIARAYRASDVT